MSGSKAFPRWKWLGMEALCQYLTGVNFLMYEQYMKIQITTESQPKADWKAVISNFQKAWLIWFPSRGNNSTGINLWMVLDNLNKSSSLPAYCMVCEVDVLLTCILRPRENWHDNWEGLEPPYVLETHVREQIK